MKNINNNRNDRKIPQQTHFIGVLLPEDIVRHRSLYNASYVRPTNRAFARFVQDVFHHRKKNLLIRTYIRVLRAEP